MVATTFSVLATWLHIMNLLNILLQYEFLNGCDEDGYTSANSADEIVPIAEHNLASRLKNAFLYGIGVSVTYRC